jgi:crossover junction endodeoxyribonuclease RusA
MTETPQDRRHVAQDLVGALAGLVEKPDVLEITVYGSPAPQGSKRFVGHAKSGRGILIESSKAVKPWREAVKFAAIVARVARGSAGFALRGPLSVEMVFTLPKPKSAPKSRKTYPDRKPDLSKLVRSTEDALTDAAIWEDDARVVSCMARKVFPGEDPASLGLPGALIRISAVTA